MPKKTIGQLKDEVKKKYLELIIGVLEEQGEDVGFVAGNRINFPYVDEEGNEGWIEIPVIIPTKNEGAPYDGFERREGYEFTLKEAQMRKEKAELAKQKRLEEAKKKKAEQKAKREAEKAELEERKQQVADFYNE